MKSRILKTVLSLLVPIVIDYVVKKMTTKNTKPTNDTKNLEQ